MTQTAKPIRTPCIEMILTAVRKHCAPSADSWADRLSEFLAEAIYGEEQTIDSLRLRLWAVEVMLARDPAKPNKNFRDRR